MIRRHAGAATSDPDTLVGLAADDSYLVRRQAVDNPATPQWVLDLLVRAGADAKLRGRAPADPTMTADDLRRVVECGPFARALVADHPNTDGDVLAALAADPSVAVRASVATHGATPAESLARLCADGDVTVRTAAVANTGHPDDVVELFRRAGADALLEGTDGQADPASVSPDQLHLLFGLGTFGRLVAVRHPGCPTELVAAAASDEDLLVRSAVLGHRVPDDVVRLVAGDGVDATDLAAIRVGPPSALGSLASSSNAAVRLAVVRSPHADHDLVSPLLADVDARVRTEAARSERADRAMVDLLRRAGATDDLSALAEPGDVTDDELRRLAAGGPWARLLAVRHPTAPPDVLAALLAGGDPKLREWAAAHPRVPIDVVELLLRAGAADDFQGVADGDPDLSADALRRVAALGPYAAFVAAWHPSAPEDLHRARNLTV